MYPQSDYKQKLSQSTLAEFIRYGHLCNITYTHDSAFPTLLSART